MNPGESNVIFETSVFIADAREYCGPEKSCHGEAKVRCVI